MVSKQTAVISRETEKYQEALAAIQAVTTISGLTTTSGTETEPITSTEAISRLNEEAEYSSSSNSAPTTASQMEANIIGLINEGEEAIAAMVATLAMLNQLLAELQSGRRRVERSSPQVSCQHLVQTVAQMVSALPEDPDKVLALANGLEESLKLKGRLTCSADQISFLRKQRDWLGSQLDLN